MFDNMTGNMVELRAILDGPFATAAFDYRLDASRFAFDQTGFENAHAAGKGRLSAAPVTVPIRFTAARVTGVGTVAGGILRNLSVDGLLRVTPTLLTGDALKLRSDKLTGSINLAVDLRNGQFEVGINGGLGRYLIPGLGIVDVKSTLRVVPGPNRHGTRVIGQGSAQMVRLDNAFFRSLAGGLPRITTNLERTTDGVLHFTNLVLTAPQIRLTGNGYRSRDGTFHFEGGGRQQTYGPVTLKLDGQIEKPTLDLVFASPNATLGLSNVRAHLDPTAQGFAFTAAGGSGLGPFTTNGAILLPPGAGATIAIAALNVAGTKASGNVAVVDGGFNGALAVAGGGISGELLFRPVGQIQRIEGHLAAKAATLDGIALRQGKLDFVTLLDPAGTSIEASATGLGLRRGTFSLARFNGAASLRGGVGTIKASIAGSRGRAFDIQSVTQVTANSYAIAAQGTLDGRPLKLLTPRGRHPGRRRLAPRTDQAQLLGRRGPGRRPLHCRQHRDRRQPDAHAARHPRHRLSRARSQWQRLGKLHDRDRKWCGPDRQGERDDPRPQPRRPRPLVAADRRRRRGGALPDKLGLRAVIASAGKTIGRAQAQLAPLGQGDLASRISNARLFGQLRYSGPADTLWRLTGVELFDLSGPVAIGADVVGTLANPTLRGVVQANGARIESATTGTVLTNVQATGRFGGSRLVIDRFGADAGKGGRVTGTGQFEFAAVAGIGLDLALQADKAVMINRDDIGATVSGPLTFKSNGSGGTIAGDVILDKSRYRLGQATAASAVPQLNIREINLPDGGEEIATPTKPWTLAIKARAPNQVMVSGLGLTSEWSANLQIAGQPENPAITGRATLIRGDYEFAGRQFELARGVIRFDGQVPANPALDIEANADSTGLSASIRVTGYALKPEIGFTSTPALPEDELLSRLLFGTSITNLSAPEALQLAAAVAALQGGGSGLNPINAVRRAAGLDRLRILPRRSADRAGHLDRGGQIRHPAPVCGDRHRRAGLFRHAGRVPGHPLAVAVVEHLHARPPERQRPRVEGLLTDDRARRFR
uniref:translocation/assembly module TamB domain-containing protein n=1 Tax=Sphingomonas sp. H160509 TaxID=2955313 RepID=UPI003158871D